MANLKRVFALLIDGSMDISLGIIAAAATGYILSETLTWGQIIIGIVGAFAPDIDGLYYFVAKSGLKNTDNLYTHRSGLHYPLMYLPLAAIVVLLLGLMAYPFYYVLITITFFVGSFLHFVHDTFIHGWGIPWLYPFSKMRVAAFAHTKREKKLPIIFTFPIADLTLIRENFRDKNWYELFYRFPPHPWIYIILITHILGFLIFLSITIA